MACRRVFGVAAAALLMACPLGPGALAQSAYVSPPAPLPPPPPVVPEAHYGTMASDPDPRDFVRRAGTQLELLGVPERFGGFDIGWLGLRRDGDAGARRPTAFEVRDALRTVNAMGGAVLRSRSLAASVGCALCLEPAPGEFSADGFAAIDLVLKTAGDLGLKVILPLAGGSADCRVPDAADAALPAGESSSEAGSGSICTYLRWHGLTDRAAFFTDPQVRADFMAHVSEVLNHVNALTGVPYRQDPAVLAWENCDGCGQDGDPAAVSAWVETVGQAIKAADQYHLYENGAFAGRIGPRVAHPVAAALFATPSVDILGDRMPPDGDPAAARSMLIDTVAAAAASGRVYVLDSFGWSQGLWKTTDDLSAMLGGMERVHALSGVLVSGLEAHAEGGGFLPAPVGAHPAGMGPLYFPGVPVAGTDAADMLLRDRLLRRFNYAMGDVMETPAPLLPPPPEIISVVKGRVVWRGAAGAASYTIERSADPLIPGSWQTLCDRCASDLTSGWQDPERGAWGGWYRVIAANINGHTGNTSGVQQGK
jgi:mannan endo-1,4-beta-mannosidase